MKADTVLIYSGGLDSTTLLYYLLHYGYCVKALGFNYGQRHVKELDAASKICRVSGVSFEVVELGALAGILAGSSLTSPDIEVPEGHYADENMKVTVVPNRNMIMLSIAIGHAVSLGCGRVAYGAHAGDHAIYPDCRPAFVGAMRRVACLCDWKAVDIFAPFLDETKVDIVKKGKNLEVPFGMTWTCYKGCESHCGKCGSCVERREAFQLADVIDPTVYECGEGDAAEN